MRDERVPTQLVEPLILLLIGFGAEGTLCKDFCELGLSLLHLLELGRRAWRGEVGSFANLLR